MFFFISNQSNVFLKEQKSFLLNQHIFKNTNILVGESMLKWALKLLEEK